MNLDFLSWLIPSIVSIIGFFLTYFLTNKNMKDEIQKMKNSIAVEKLQNAFDVMFNNHKSSIPKEIRTKRFLEIYNDLKKYGSPQLSKIAADYQLRNYPVNDIIYYNAILCAQLKYETVGYYISPLEFMKTTIKDYDKWYDDYEVKHKINKIIRKEGYSKKLKCRQRVKKNKNLKIKQPEPIIEYI